MTMPWRDSWAGRVTRRIGRTAVGLISGACGLIVPALYVAFAGQFNGGRLAGSCAIGLFVAMLVFLGLDKLGIVPDDSDPPINLQIRSR